MFLACIVNYSAWVGFQIMYSFHLRLHILHSTCWGCREIHAKLMAFKYSLWQWLGDFVGYTWGEIQRKLQTVGGGGLMFPSFTKSGLFFTFDVRGSAHHSINSQRKSNKMKQCTNIFYFIFIWSSTCFGRHTAHHQEPKTALAACGFAYVEGLLDV